MKEKIFLMLAIISSSVYFTAFYLEEGDPALKRVIQEIPAERLNGMLPDEINNIQVNNTTAPSVVNVSSIKQHRDFFGVRSEPSGGSGFVWDKEGHIVTNDHVIKGVDKIFITLHNDNQQYEAKVVGRAARKDIAVLKIDVSPDKLIPINRGISSDLLVGQKTLALGNPFGLDHTLTTGIISALDRKINGAGGVEIHGIIQTDASINPGNSGGPLLNSKGELIGMNTAIISKSGSSSGLGFAVPVDTVTQIVPQLIKHGKEIRPTLGVEIEGRVRLNRGVAIRVAMGAAKDAGLEGMKVDRWGRVYYGDIITQIEDTKINSLNDLYHCLSQYKIGDDVKVTFIRQNKLMTTNVTLQSN